MTYVFVHKNDLWKDIADVLIKTYDHDSQVHFAKAMASLPRNSLGCEFADWAKSNSMCIHTLLYLVSVAVRAAPKDKNFFVTKMMMQLPLRVKGISKSYPLFPAEEYYMSNRNQSLNYESETSACNGGISLIKVWR